METRQCRKCGCSYPLNRDHFGNTPNGGFRYTCRACMRANTARHYASNPEKVFERVAQRKDQDLNAEGLHDLLHIALIREALEDCCRYCGVPLDGRGEVDHIVPISRGGTHWPSNITLACKDCNRGKHSKTDDEYVAWRKARGLSVRQLRSGGLTASSTRTRRKRRAG